ncbi:MAG: hypothetical protein AAFV51_10890 [Pseudomonadota bacterium]
MKQPLGVGDILTESFRFGGSRIATVLRVVWAPLVVLAVIWGGAMFAVFGSDFAAFETMTEEEAVLFILERLFTPSTMLAFVALGLVSAFVYSGAMAAIFRLVALDEEPQGAFFVRFDGPSVRTGVAAILYNAIFYVIAGIAGWIAVSRAGGAPDLAAIFADEPDADEALAFAQIAGLTFLISILPLAYLGVKLTPFLPGTASENRLLFVNSFSLTAGYFWSILGLFVVLFAAVIGLSLAFELLQGAVQLLQTAISVVGGEAGKALASLIFGLVILVATIAFQLFLTGVQLAAPALVYRRLDDIKNGSEPA